MQIGLPTIVDLYQVGQSALTCRFQREGSVGSMCGYGGRRYLTKEEKVEWLEEYKSDLEKELAGVKERLDELKH